MELLTSIIAASILDLAIGDPAWLPHPIRWMGGLIEKLEAPFRTLRISEKTQGLVFALALISITWSAALLGLKIAAALHPFFGWTLQTLLIFYSLSVKSLRQAAMGVFDALKLQDLETARNRIAMAVSRDTRELDADGVARAAVETVAENLVDGVISPLFFAVLGGAPLAMAFKMASTLDSMVGYKTERYLEFGKASARIDDGAGFIPARLSVPIISLFAEILWKRGKTALDTAIREGSHHASPNAGYPEAAFAGALGVKLNGPSAYHGKWVDKPFIGVDFGPVAIHHIPKACDLMVKSAMGFMAAAVIFRGLISLLWG